jgi:Ser/Thr protein kinase RdoA (MazF antagonist)
MIVPRFTAEQAQELAKRHWGIVSVAHELPSSIDQNFRLETAEKGFVLKISNSDEVPEYLAAQIRALEHLARRNPDRASDDPSPGSSAGARAGPRRSGQTAGRLR